MIENLHYNTIGSCQSDPFGMTHRHIFSPKLKIKVLRLKIGVDLNQLLDLRKFAVMDQSMPLLFIYFDLYLYVKIMVVQNLIYELLIEYQY